MLLILGFLLLISKLFYYVASKRCHEEHDLFQAGWCEAARSLSHQISGGRLPLCNS